MSGVFSVAESRLVLEFAWWESQTPETRGCGVALEAKPHRAITEVGVGFLSLLGVKGWVMQDFVHQQYYKAPATPQTKENALNPKPGDAQALLGQTAVTSFQE